MKSETAIVSASVAAVAVAAVDFLRQWHNRNS